MNIKNKLLLHEMVLSCIVLLLLVIFRNYWDFLDAFHFIVPFVRFSVLNLIWPVFFIIIFIFYIMHCFVIFRSTVQHKSMRKNLSYISLFLIFWLLVRMIKYDMSQGVIVRLLWYLYYIPMLFVPLFGLYTISYIGHGDSWKMSNIKKYYFFISSILFLLVMTNEFHHQCFRFDPQQFEIDGKYTYGNGYYLVAAWMLFLIGSTLKEVYTKCRIMASRKKIWLPLCILVIPVGWSLIKWLFDIELVEISVIFIWSYLVLWLSLIYTGLIPSNIEYEMLFDEANISALILNENNDIVYSTKNKMDISKYLIEKSKTEETKLDERTLIKSASIQGGSIIWLEDISSMNIMISKLKKLQEQLEDNNELLQAEINLKEKQERIRTQNLLYDQIVKELSISIEKLNESLNQENPDLSRICFLGAYIKRMSNLIILQQGNQKIESRELNYCMKESMDVLNMKGILCSFHNEVDSLVDIRILKKVYTIFVASLDHTYDSLSSVLVNFKLDNSIYVLRLTMEGNFLVHLKGNINADIFEEENTTYVVYKIKKEDVL